MISTAMASHGKKVFCAMAGLQSGQQSASNEPRSTAGPEHMHVSACIGSARKQLRDRFEAVSASDPTAAALWAANLIVRARCARSSS